MSLREARREIAELKERILARYPAIVLKEGPGFEGGPKDIYLYAYADEDKRDAIREMSSPRVLDILLKTGIYVHVIPLNPGTMAWLWDNGKKKTRRAAPRPGARVVAERRATYKAAKRTARRKVT